ncbi:DUF2812 domain-containing protein [Lentibacillus cibarius]|uniref:DUF2812 domain-containing protein n=1 Tax=Lentibacillus cibarius TaxID=2583219 RepID=A0A549YGH5_9BACI|nr:DUF2812 domain-containing protein [Lentibacillus cibarius]TRM10974.1 DUF2812 domain-containing protein [Lentibacillus cibarius]
MISVFKPFWSYDIAKTEKWLSDMAAQGWSFVDMNTATRQFFFDKEIPEDVTFRIQYDKNAKLPVALENDGWHLVFQHRKWQVFRNDQPAQSIRTFPIRDGIIKRNRILMYVFGGVFLYHIFTFFIFLLINVLILTAGGDFHVEGSPFWVVTIAYWMVVWGLVPYSFIKLYRSLRRLKFGTRTNQTSEKPAETTGRTLTKWKFGWNYAPDKLEQWLMKMEKSGYNLMRINMFGLRFQFQEGTPKQISYCADYQNSHQPDYFDMHQQAGWRLMYSSEAFLSKWAIWAKAYQAGEAPPQLYSDNKHMRKHARRILITNLALFVPIIVIYIALIQMNINMAQTHGLDMNWILVFLLCFIIIEYAILLIKSLLYYRRVKKRVD